MHSTSSTTISFSFRFSIFQCISIHFNCIVLLPSFQHAFVTSYSFSFTETSMCYGYCLIRQILFLFISDAAALVILPAVRRKCSGDSSDFTEFKRFKITAKTRGKTSSYEKKRKDQKKEIRKVKIIQDQESWDRKRKIRKDTSEKQEQKRKARKAKEDEGHSFRDRRSSWLPCKFHFCTWNALLTDSRSTTKCVAEDQHVSSAVVLDHLRAVVDILCGLLSCWINQSHCVLHPRVGIHTVVEISRGVMLQEMAVLICFV